MRESFENSAQVGGVDHFVDGHTRGGGQAVLQILLQRTIPYLDCWIYPGDVRAQGFDGGFVQFPVVYEDMSNGRAMPSEQGSDQAGFAGAGWSYDGDVFAGLDGEINILKNAMAGGGYTDIFEYD